MKKPIHQSLTFFVTAAVALVLVLSTCGKKGDLEPPEGKKDEFPRQYPDPSSL